MTVVVGEFMARPPAPSDARLGMIAAQSISFDIAAHGRPVGEVVGSEAHLMARYGVSRSVLREAARFLEHLGVARMRRGPGGGLVVTQPDHTAVVDAVIVHLTHERVPFEEVLDARAIVERVSVRLAASRSTGSAPLRSGAFESPGDTRREIEFHLAIARMSENPAIELFVEILGEVCAQFDAGRSAPRRRSGCSAAADHAHDRIADAVQTGDVESAERRMATHLAAVREFYGPRSRERHLASVGVSLVLHPDATLAPAVAQQIFRLVVALGWPVGLRLGSESELLSSQQVSRSVLREALRLLEFNGVVVPRRGPGGGVFVAAPNRESIVATVATYLESRRVTPSHLFELRNEFEIAALDLAMARDEITELRSRLEPIDAADAAGLRTSSQQLHRLIAELSGNRVMSTFLHALTEVSALHSRPPDAVPDETVELRAEQVTHAHDRIVDAIEAGDRQAARRRLRRHLDALLPHHH